MTEEESNKLLYAQLHGILLRVQRKGMAIEFATHAILKSVQAYLRRQGSIDTSQSENQNGDNHPAV